MARAEDGDIETISAEVQRSLHSGNSTDTVGAPERQEQSVSIQDLPAEVIAEIVNKFEYYNDIVKAGGLCKAFRAAVKGRRDLHESIVLRPGTRINKSFALYMLENRVCRKFKGENLTGQAHQAVHAFKHIQELSLTNCDFVGDEFIQSLHLQGLKLEALEIKSCPKLKSAVIGMHTLKRVNIVDCRMIYLIISAAIHAVNLSSSTLAHLWTKNRFPLGVLFNQCVVHQRVKSVDISDNVLPRDMARFSDEDQDPTLLQQFLCGFPALEEANITDVIPPYNMTLDLRSLARLRVLKADRIRRIQRIVLPPSTKEVSLRSADGLQELWIPGEASLTTVASQQHFSIRTERPPRLLAGLQPS
eukprot:CAMPEP_0198730336 /NCGR_PEP_ID=MMETSP1475-20131203/24079_1 /TAXON_ID= ORGANISM="Unidentified sp., Strain CCMP1999" /NCGR_SAMPLE_ID=MMETSP1475 /ASSEMBLY_ACC=CAM_ASM_001111 /LENGTH=359 /DNA_ID=CAMNT_0044493127 /DNA_START=69 /DNA_END=1148 /DNA_ORIENTATION=+